MLVTSINKNPYTQQQTTTASTQPGSSLAASTSDVELVQFKAVTAVEEEDKAKINKLYGQLIGQMNNLSSVNRSQAAAITGKDFSNIKAEMKEAAFVPQVQSFLQNIIDDGQRVEALGKDGQVYLQEIRDTNAALDALCKEKGYTNEELTGAMEPTTSGLMQSATEELANSTATLVDTAKTYGDRLDGKAQELLAAWDKTKHNEKKQEIMDGILTAFALFANVGIGGNAIVQFAMKDMAKMTESIADAWGAVGQRAGQLSNLFGAITAVDLRAYANSSPGSVAAVVNSGAESSHEHLATLKARFDQYVEEYNNQEPPDSGWYIPTV